MSLERPHRVYQNVELTADGRGSQQRLPLNSKRFSRTACAPWGTTPADGGTDELEALGLGAERIWVEPARR